MGFVRLLPRSGSRSESSVVAEKTEEARKKTFKKEQDKLEKELGLE